MVNNNNNSKFYFNNEDVCGKNVKGSTINFILVNSISPLSLLIQI